MTGWPIIVGRVNAILMKLFDNVYRNINYIMLHYYCYLLLRLLHNLNKIVIYITTKHFF